MRDLSKRKGGLATLLSEVFTGVTAVVNTASERVLAQLRQHPLLGADGEGA